MLVREAPGTLRHLAPTDLTGFLRLESCARFLWYRLHPPETRALFERWNLAEQFLTPLLAVRGAEREVACHRALEGQGHRVVDLRRGSPEDTLRHLRSGEAVTLVEAHVRGHLGEFTCGGRADIVQIRARGPKSVGLHVIDIKASRKDRLEHRVQVAIYCELLEQMALHEGLEPRLKGSVWRLPERRSDQPTTFDLLPSRQTVNGMVEAPTGVAWRMARAPREEARIHLTRRCVGCPYNALCMREAFETRSLALVPCLGASEQGTLARHGITRVEELATLKELPAEEEPDAPLRTPSERAAQVAALDAGEALGADLDLHIQRARAVAHRFSPDVQARSWLQGPGSRQNPPPGRAHPGEVRVFLEAWWDYLEDRVYLLGALVVGPQSRREVVRLAQAPPDTGQEKALLEDWATALEEALEACAPHAVGPVRLFLYERQDLKAIRDALTRHGEPGGHPFLTRLQALKAGKTSFLAEEVRRHYNLGLLGHSLPQVAREMGFDWTCEGRPLDQEFRPRLFDSLVRLPDGTCYEGAARFGSQVPLEYAYGAWQRLPPPKQDRRRVLEGFRQATREGLLTLARARLRALAHVEGTLRSKNLGRTRPGPAACSKGQPRWLDAFLRPSVASGEGPALSPWPALLASLALCGALWWGHQQEMERLRSSPPPPGAVTRIGRVSHSRTTAGNGAMITIKTDQGAQTVLLSPRLGLVDPPIRSGDRVSVVAIPRVWRKRSFLLPLTRGHLQVLEKGVQDVPVSTVAEIVAMPKGIQVAVTARVHRIWEHRSRNRNALHLKFVLDDGTAQVEGIMFEAATTPLDRRRLESGRVLRIEGRTDRYNGQPSLVVRSVSEES